MEKFLYVTNTSSASFLGTFSKGEGLIEIIAKVHPQFVLFYPYSPTN